MALVERLAILIDANSQGATREFRKLSTEAKNTDTQLTKTQKASGAVTAGIKTLGIVAGGAAVAGLARFADASIQAASDLEEVRQKSQQVFEGSFGQIEKFAEGAADSLGLSTRAALEFASAFGNLFTSAGFNEQEAADLSQTLTGLAGDLASFNNISVDEAFRKLQSGLSGEAEPLRQVGVFLSAAKVEAEAFESGIAEVGTTLTEAQKIQARYNIILQETEKAQGDVERTSDSLANSQRRLAAQVENTSAQIGEDLLPIKADFVSVFADITGAIGDFDASLKTVGDGSMGLADILLKGPLWRALENIQNAWSDTGDAAMATIPPVDDFAAASRGLLDEIRPLGGATDDLVDPTNKLGGEFAYVGETAQDASDAIKVLTDAVDQMRSPVLDVRDANRDFADAIDRYHEVMRDGESTRREQEAALDDIADAAFGVLGANAEAGASTAELDRKTEALRGQLTKAQTEYDTSADKAENYANKIGLIPGSVTTSVRLAGIDSAIAQAERLRDLTTGLSVSQLTSVVRQDEAMARRRASGGPVGPGTYLVGEQGPELLSLASGTGRVFSNAQTGPMLSNNNSRSFTVNGNVILQTPDPSRSWDVLNDLAVA